MPVTTKRRTWGRPVPSAPEERATPLAEAPGGAACVGGCEALVSPAGAMCGPCLEGARILNRKALRPFAAEVA
jgi:hypothetical protein